MLWASDFLSSHSIDHLQCFVFVLCFSYMRSSLTHFSSQSDVGLPVQRRRLGFGLGDAGSRDQGGAELGIESIRNGE